MIVALVDLRLGMPLVLRKGCSKSAHKTIVSTAIKTTIVFGLILAAALIVEGLPSGRRVTAMWRYFLAVVTSDGIPDIYRFHLQRWSWEYAWWWRMGGPFSLWVLLWVTLFCSLFKRLWMGVILGIVTAFVTCDAVDALVRAIPTEEPSNHRQIAQERHAVFSMELHVAVQSADEENAAVRHGSRRADAAD